MDHPFEVGDAVTLKSSLDEERKAKVTRTFWVSGEPAAEISVLHPDNVRLWGGTWLAKQLQPRAPVAGSLERDEHVDAWEATERLHLAHARIEAALLAEPENRAAICEATDDARQALQILWAIAADD